MSTDPAARMALTAWHDRARELPRATQAFINGRYVKALSNETFDCISPIDGRLLARVAASTAVDVDAAVGSARAAFERGTWSRMPPGRRKRVLHAFAEELRTHAEELALLETLDVGKPISDSQLDIQAAADSVSWFAEAIDKVYGEVAPTAHDTLALVTREPVGVVGAIVPWNYPLLMACWKLAPALAAGNSVVLKPSEKSPLTALRIAGLAASAGLPEGVLNVLPGFGPIAGKALALNMDVDCIAFTGSTATGRHILQYAGRSNMKRVWLECGGKSPHIVMDDCADLDRAARAVALGIFLNQGQMCSAGSRLLVQDAVRGPLLERIVRFAGEFLPGDPLDPATRLGALVDQSQCDAVMRYVESAKAEGARLAVGGRRARETSGGFYMEPTVFDAVSPRMKIAQEEIFGPVLSVLSFRTADEALRVANDVIYGLAAGLWTRDIATAHRMARGLRAGTVYVNCYDADDNTVPFGGFKQSGNGRDKSLHAFDKYLELKTTWFDLS